MFKIDMHCHTKFSHDNFFEPEDLIKKAIEVGLDGICITEHFSIDASSFVESIQIPEGFLVFRGAEVSTNLGHLLIFGLEDDRWNIWNRNLFLNFFEVVEEVHRLGGICIPSHPFRGIESIGDFLFKEEIIEVIDGIEVFNGRTDELSNKKAFEFAKKMDLPMIAGSDSHSEEEVGKAYTIFEQKISTIEDLIFAIKNKKTKPFIRGISDATDA